jgi:two-component system chemotaxis family response regulator WspR
MSQSNPNSNQTAPASPSAGGATLRVLLVDDQAIVAEAIRRMLADQTDIEFHYCANPSDAVEMANRLQPTVILQDLIMPSVNGLTMVRRFRLNPATHATPIIILTTKESPVFKKDAFAAGANDYLIKLPNPATLIACIRSQEAGSSSDSLSAVETPPAETRQAA